jgi:hypothetical protein
MKPHPALPLSIAALAFAVLFPASTIPASAQSERASPSQSSTPPGGMREAMRMVPARAALDRNLIASKVTPGSEFRAKLAKKVQLDNGPELPAGTVLVGEVSTDDMNVSGTSKLALRFTHAMLKNGQTVPIKATIVAIYSPENSDADSNPVAPGDQAPNSWNDGTLAVDQIDALPGVDLHSKIASRNSAVFVSSTKDNMKLRAGSELALAIAQQNHPMHGMGGMNTNQ